MTVKTALLKKIDLSNNELKVIIGAAAIKYKGWIDTEEKDLDVVSTEDWEVYFKPESIKCLLAEHVWEHIDPANQELATLNCFRFLEPGGLLRIAVPDGYRTEPVYLEEVLPPKDGHTMMFNYQTLSRLLEKCGFQVTLLEYFDENGKFNYKPWNPENGMIRRSLKYDSQNRFRYTSNGYRMKYTSLIVDAVKPG